MFLNGRDAGKRKSGRAFFGCLPTTKTANNESFEMPKWQSGGCAHAVGQKTTKDGNQTRQENAQAMIETLTAAEATMHKVA
jgi:hypothetical protein